MRILKILQKKGRIASLAGFMVAMPINGWAVINYITNSKTFSYDELRFLFVANFIGWIWVVLPSKVSAKFLKGEIVIED